ncbi:hypothetical protein [Roseateles asaccharophilus]|uniref:Uncharacterized protein n=1 Tax=Roseateles asaccharophilus TaxID=582607 RepID=A0ABU2A3G5_9BURK|nr:hypothetical protein [Roseateles asaccharophilus]MDR7331732.1 hypothetical protein [Roseateles asaccharophilus]
MNHVAHPTNNATLAPPPGMTPDQCDALPITRILYDQVDGSTIPACVSFWQPSAEQLALLNAGRPVWLSALGLSHPPVMLGVEGDGRLL